ncbi:MAG: MFS transporter [Acidimicrobiia bacterium]|nr:MFS transporter [Acidimicrobiia bacterium]
MIERTGVPAGTPPGARWRLVAGLAVTQTVSWGVLYYAFSVLLVPMQDDLGWSRSVLVGGFTTAVVISGLSAPLVGRLLDAEVTRPLIVGGSVLGTAAVLGWSRVGSELAYYAMWAAIGLAMAAVLYEPAFTVLAKRTAPDHRRAITAVTLLAGLASFVFQPFTSALTGQWGWRTALVVLAAVLAAVTVPIHVAVLGPVGRAPARPARRARARPEETSDPRFWALTAAFVGVTTASLATGVLLIAYLVDHGWSLGRAAFAGGTLGAMQLPGRLAFGPLTSRLSRRVLVAGLFTVPGVGILTLLVAGGGRGVWAAVVVLGFGQGATTLLRATLYVDLYGIERIGALNGWSGTPITCARALAPLAASLVVGWTGSYTVAFVGLVGCSVGAAALAADVLGRAPACPGGRARADVAAPDGRP